MKINNYVTLLFLCFSSVSISAQEVKTFKEAEAYQQTLRLTNPSSKEYAIAQFSKAYKLDKGTTFEAKKITTDESGLSHQRHQQFYKGLKVEFGTLITHSRNGLVESINGELYNAKSVNLNPTISPENGLQFAMNKIAATQYLWEDTANAEALNYKKPQGELVIYPNVNTGEIKLAYKYDIYTTQPISRAHVYVDAKTGMVLFSNPIIKHADKLVSDKTTESNAKKIEEITVGSKSTSALITGSAATRFSGTRSIETTLSGPSYVLNEATRGTGNGVVTYNAARTPSYAATNFTDANNAWTEYANTNKDNAALDAHWGAEMNYDFWKNVFNRNSYDDAGAKIISHVHYAETAGQNFGNAFWNGSVMTYGDGGGSFDQPLTTIDVCGHEIGHAVCEYTANLVYQNQSGALNEGFSDIWGTCIEIYGRTGTLNSTQDTATPGTLAIWQVGEDCVASGPLRSMSYPRTESQPDTYLGTTWYAGTADNGGVHINSGVLNHWFYIVTAGKSGTNNAPAGSGGPFAYNVTGIGMTKSSQIAYYAERDYLTPNSTYLDARNATIAVASALYCASSPEVQAVTKAWKAVNVGADYLGGTNEIALKTLTAVSGIACNTAYSASIVFENAGVNPINTVTITHSIDGGANVNGTWNGTLTNCNTQSYNLILGALSVGTHVLNVSVTNAAGDANAGNNAKSIVLIVNTNGTVNVVNNFNNPANTLVSIDDSGTTNSLWQRGTVAKILLTNAVAGSQVYASKLTGNYPDATTSYLVSQCYNLADVTNPQVNFDLAFDLEANWDILLFEYSLNNGTSWNVLGTSTDANWYNSSRLPDGTDCFNCIGKQWTGDYATAPAGGTGANGNKKPYTHTLSNFGFGGATPASNIMFRFKFISDEGANQEGVFIDNFVVEGTYSTVENQFENFGVYPNPSNGLFNVVLSTTEKVNLTLHDVRGRSIYNETFSSNGTVFNKEINFSTLSSGIYMLNVESAGKKATKKIIIE